MVTLKENVIRKLMITLKENVSEFRKIEIPKWHGFCNETPKELHIFRVASTMPCRATAYFRFCDQND